MGLEVAPFVQDLVVSNPISGDDVNQGDDHIRLLKTTLKATFPGTTKAIYNSTTTSKVASFSVVAADENKTFMVDATAGAVVATLPTLVSGDHGWMCFFIKMDAVNTFHIAPASGNVYSGPVAVTKARRCIPGIRFTAAWSGSSWYIERCERSPVGSLLPFQGASLPAGYEWPSGQTLASAATNYQEFVAMQGSGLTFDLRGRAAFGKDNMGGSAAGRLTAILTGTTLNYTGGVETLSLTQANLPSVSFTNSGITFSGNAYNSNTNYMSAAAGGAFTNYNHRHYTVDNMYYAGVFPAGGFNITGPAQSGGNGNYSDYVSVDHYHDFSVTPSGTITQGASASGGSGTAISNIPPAIVLNFILVVE